MFIMSFSCAIAAIKDTTIVYLDASALRNRVSQVLIWWAFVSISALKYSFGERRLLLENLERGKQMQKDPDNKLWSNFKGGTTKKRMAERARELVAYCLNQTLYFLNT